MHNARLKSQCSVSMHGEGKCPEARGIIRRGAIGPYARVRVSIDIMKPLQKMVFLELNDDNEVEMLVLYK